MKKILKFLICMLIIAGIIAVFLFIRKDTKFRKEDLVSFYTGSGGDMNGSSRRTYVKRYDESRALITVSSADWYFQDPSVHEYFADVSVLDEIREVFLKYNMQRWHNKKFTDMFVADGASTSYSFDFETDYVSFSSQIYPDRYSEKLNEIHDILNTSIAGAEKLPWLILPETDPEEGFTQNSPDNGEVTLSVFEYAQDRLSYRFANGTDEAAVLEGPYVLYKDGENEPLVQSSPDKIRTAVQPHRHSENTFKLPVRLDEGTYRFEAAGLSCTFEIGMD